MSTMTLRIWRRTAASPLLTLAAVLLLSAGLVACGGGEAPAADETVANGTAPNGATPNGAAGSYGSTPNGAAPNSAPSGGTAPGGGLGAISSRGGQVGQAPTARPDVGIQFQIPEAWQEQAPSMSMRYAQARVPGPGGDGQLTVFYFGPGGGGGVQANLDRWAGQVASSAAPKQERFDVGGLTVNFIEADGTLKASTMGVGPTEDQPGYGLLGAVVEGPGGPWFFKVTGPSETLASQREAFLGLLRGIQPSQQQA
ncbi:MAG: hypothetical protein AAGD01_20280 [Acidobacteriota bacterium]